MAKRRKGDYAEGNTDIAAARAIRPNIMAEYQGYGLMPPLTEAPVRGSEVGQPRRRAGQGTAAVQAELGCAPHGKFQEHRRPPSVDFASNRNGKGGADDPSSRYQGAHGSGGFRRPARRDGGPSDEGRPGQAHQERLQGRPASSVPGGLGRTRGPESPLEQIRARTPRPSGRRPLKADSDDFRQAKARHSRRAFAFWRDDPVL